MFFNIYGMFYGKATHVMHFSLLNIGCVCLLLFVRLTHINYGKYIECININN